jgi:outer membrane receptor protein involved in Fe transport
MIAGTAANAAEQAASSEEQASGISEDSSEKADTKSRPSSSDILVTGSRIRRTNVNTAAPITVVDKEMIEERGLGRLSDTLSAMPQITPALGDRGSQDPRVGASRINLRNLGTGRSLILLNGERMDNDANIIPSALIERVDVLTGGASAVYGSDAIAGVVNFIVKRRFQGLEMNLEASTQQSTNDNQFMLDLLEESGYPIPKKHVWGGQQYFGSLTAGQNFADDRGNISVFASYTRTRPMESTKFDHTSCPVYMNPQNPVPAYQTNEQWSCGFTEYNPYNWFGAGSSEWTNAKDGSREWRPYDPDDIARVPQRDWMQRSGRRVNAGGFFTFDFTSSLRFDASFLYTHDESEGRNAQAVGFYAPEFQMPCDNPYMSGQQAQIVCGANAGVAGTTAPFTMTVFRPDYSNSYKYALDTWRAAGHVSGEIVDNINFDASFQRSGRTERYNGTDIFDYWTMYDRFQRSMQVVNHNGVPTCTSVIDGTDPSCIPLDAFSANGPDDAVWKYLTRDGGSKVTVEQVVINGSVSGTLENYGIKSPWADDGVGFALVAEHRWNRVSEEGSGAYDWWSRYSSTDKVDELGGELSLPLVQGKRFVEDLTVSGAYRLSDYQSLSGLVKTWKADFIYRPFAGLGFRGSINRALRRGVLERLQQANPYTGTFQDRCAAPAPGSAIQRLSFDACAATGMTREQYDALGLATGCDTAQYCNVLYRPGGNPNLQPEKSRSITLGVVAQPRFLPGFSGSVDFFKIRVDGAFEWVRTGIIADQCFNQQVAFFCGLIDRNPTTGAITEVNAQYNNSGFLETRGVDFSLYYGFTIPQSWFGTDLGRLNLGFSGTLNTADKRQFAPNTPVYSCLGYFGFFCNNPSPKYRHYMSLGWDMPWKGNINLTWRYAAPTRNSKLSPEAPLSSVPSDINTDSYPLIPRLPAQSLFDLALSYPVTKDIELRFNVQNLFDKDPPIVGRADAGTGEWFNTFPAYYNAWGRTLRVGLRAKLW